MSISFEQIKSLRDRTGVSITTCKKALEEANGDEELALEILRKKGEAKAAERADRVTSQGVVAISGASQKMAMVALGCETDFVAKNEDFIKEAEKLTQKLLESGESVDLSEVAQDLNIRMGEKVVVLRQAVLESERVGSYLHSNRRIGVLVALSGGDEELARDVAMHIAASRPATISPDEVSAELVEKEKIIWMDQLEQEGKPEQIRQKILEGKEKKYREESALLTQPFVKNPEITVGQLLKDVKVLSFVRFEV